MGEERDVLGEAPPAVRARHAVVVHGWRRAIPAAALARAYHCSLRFSCLLCFENDLVLFHMFLWRFQSASATLHSYYFVVHMDPRGGLPSLFHDALRWGRDF